MNLILLYIIRNLMVQKYIILIFIFIVLFGLGWTVSNRKYIKKEYFEDTKNTSELQLKTGEFLIEKSNDPEISSKTLESIEIIENTQLHGSFKLLDPEGKLELNLNDIKLVFDSKDTSNGFTILYQNKKIDSKEFLVKSNTQYNYSIYWFPLQSQFLFFVSTESDKSNLLLYHLKHFTLEEQVYKPTLISINSKLIYTLISSKTLPFTFYTDSTELFKISSTTSKKYLNCKDTTLEIINQDSVGDKKTVIWNIERHTSYYTISNIMNNLYLGIDKKSGKMILSAKIDTPNKFYILQGKHNFVLVNYFGFILGVDSLEQNVYLKECILEKVENIGQWITYGSSLKLLNNNNQLLSGNLNFRYDISGLPSVYSDDLGDNQLTQWTIEDYDNKQIGSFVKEGDSIYLKNNNKYLQIIKGYFSTNESDSELSLDDVKNGNSRWEIHHKNSSEKDRLFRNNTEIYLYHPKSESYLYNTEGVIKIANKDKVEIVGKRLDSTNRNKNNSLWTIQSVMIEVSKGSNVTVDYYKYNSDVDYFKNKEEKWKNKLIQIDTEIKNHLSKYQGLQDNEKNINAYIVKSKQNYSSLSQEKCPPTKVCLSGIDFACVPPPKKETSKDEKESLYDIVYSKKNKNESKKKIVNANKIEKCKSLRDMDINGSSFIKDKTYIPREAVKLKITDFKFEDFPEAKDLVSIESIPEDKKITDFNISDLPGFSNLKLKSQYETK